MIEIAGKGGKSAMRSAAPTEWQGAIHSGLESVNRESSEAIYPVSP